VVQRRDRAVVALEKTRVFGGFLEAFAWNHPQHPHRVVRGRALEAVVERAEYLSRVPMPAPPQIDGEFFESGDPLRQRRKAAISGHGQAPTRVANFERSMFPPE